MPNLTFNAERHEYSIDGVIIPGFSRIAKDLGLVDYSRVKQSDLDWKRDLGRAVHTAIFLHNTNDLDMDSLDPAVEPYFRSWLRFVELYQPKILTQYSEIPMCSFKWRYGVTPDIFAEIQGALTILEVKSVSQMLPATALQTEAQKIAAEEYYHLKIKQRWGLQLIPGALPKLEPYTNASDNSAWLSAVNLWHYKERNSLWKPLMLNR